MSVPADEETSHYVKTLLNLILPPLAGMLVVLFLITFLYWLSLNLFVRVQPEVAGAAYSVGELVGYPAAAVALVVIITGAAILLSGIRTLKAFAPPLQRLKEMETEAESETPEIITRARVWFYGQLRRRILLFIIVSMGTTFLLLAGLYLFVLNNLFSLLAGYPQLIESILTYLRYYGVLVFFALVLSGFFVTLISLRQLAMVVGVSDADLSKFSCEQDRYADLDELEAELERKLFDSSDFFEEAG